MPDSPDATSLLRELLSLGMTHLVGLPDNGSARLFEVAAEDADVDLLTVTREGEAFAIASGMWLGGCRPVVVVQNTGLLESGDSLRGTALRMGAPLLVLIGVRGDAKMKAHAESIAQARAAGRSGDTMKRPDIDSVALMTEPTLRAWEIPYREYATDADGEAVRALWELADAESRPVALLLPRNLT